MIKKIVSALFVFVFAVNLLVAPTASAEIGDKAIVDFSKGTPEYTNIKQMNFGEVDNSFDYIKRAGRNALRMIKARTDRLFTDSRRSPTFSPAERLAMLSLK